MKKVWWEILLRGKIIDTVQYDGGADEWYVRHSLINHDGYDPAITIRKRRG